MRTTAEKRHNDWCKAIRKRKIVTDIFCWKEGWYDNLHQYSKNKVHCSCPLCNPKTNNKHRNGSRGREPSKNWSHSDRQKLDEMEDQILDNE